MWYDGLVAYGGFNPESKPEPKWTQFTRRTAGHKLDWIKRMLNREGCTWKQEGESFYAPAIYVDSDLYDCVGYILDSEIDDADDYDELFLTTLGPEAINRELAREVVNSTPVVIFDIDGTIADNRHRVHFIEDKDHRDWAGFFEAQDQDAPKAFARVLNQLLHGTYEIHIVTARGEEHRGVTERWLKTHDFKYEKLHFVREEGNREEDSVLKIKWLEGRGSEFADRIECVFDDRSRVCKAWRDAGLTCYQVDEGDF